MQRGARGGAAPHCRRRAFSPELKATRAAPALLCPRRKRLVVRVRATSRRLLLRRRSSVRALAAPLSVRRHVSTCDDFMPTCVYCTREANHGRVRQTLHQSAPLRRPRATSARVDRVGVRRVGHAAQILLFAFTGLAVHYVYLRRTHQRGYQRASLVSHPQPRNERAAPGPQRRESSLGSPSQQQGWQAKIPRLIRDGRPHDSRLEESFTFHHGR